MACTCWHGVLSSESSKTDVRHIWPHQDFGPCQWLDVKAGVVLRYQSCITWVAPVQPHSQAGNRSHPKLHSRGVTCADGLQEDQKQHCSI